MRCQPKILCFRLFRFIFLFISIQSFKFSFVGERHVAFDLTIVEIVDLSRLEVAEELDHVTHRTNTKPEGNDDRDRSRNQQAGHKEVTAPPFQRPLLEEIPDHDDHKRTEETVDDRITENRPGDDAIPKGVFRGDADQFIADRPQGPGGSALVEVIQIIFSAMEHAVQIERFFAGELGNGDVQRHCHNERNKIEFVGVDEALVGIDPPDDEWFKGTGDAFDDRRETVEPVHVFEKCV